MTISRLDLLIDHIKVSARGTVPDPDPSTYPPIPEIRAIFARVHDRAMAELIGSPKAVLSAPLRPGEVGR